MTLNIITLIEIKSWVFKKKPPKQNLLVSLSSAKCKVSDSEDMLATALPLLCFLHLVPQAHVTKFRKR